MPKGRQSPGVGRGHNSGEVPHEEIRAALALDILHRERVAAATEARKAARKSIEGRSIPLADLDALYKRKDMTAGELEQELRRSFHFFAAINPNLADQYDLFTPKPSAPERRAAFYTQGLMAGLQGKKLVIPPAVVGDEREQMIQGHNDGSADREKANLQIMADAVKGDTQKPAQDAAKVNDKAAKDFAQDQGEDPLVVNGVRYTSMVRANAARKKLEDEKAKEAANQAPAADAPAAEPAPAEPTAEEPAAEEPVAAAESVPYQPFDDSKLDEDLDNWFARDKEAFRKWYEGLLAGIDVHFTNPASAKFFAELGGPKPAAETPAAVDDGFDEPKIIAGPAPKGATYRLASDEPTDGRVPTYRDGVAFSKCSEGNSEIPIYDTHPDEEQAKPKSQSQIAAEKRADAKVS